uniref:Uncharacterized protein n=1 Tax=Anguilla anguilla TaxID=7936 RepID=A0A0E9T579_ANGAN
MFLPIVTFRASPPFLKHSLCIQLYIYLGIKLNLFKAIPLAILP